MALTRVFRWPRLRSLTLALTLVALLAVPALTTSVSAERVEGERDDTTADITIAVDSDTDNNNLNLSALIATNNEERDTTRANVTISITTPGAAADGSNTLTVNIPVV